MDLLHRAHEAGFGSVMFDASKLDYEENVRATAAAVAWGHERGVWIEAELGKVGGKEGEAPSTPTPPASAPTRTRPPRTSPRPVWTPWPSRSAPRTP